jgi:hypothetical protein
MGVFPDGREHIRALSDFSEEPCGSIFRGEAAGFRPFFNINHYPLSLSLYNKHMRKRLSRFSRDQPRFFQDYAELLRPHGGVYWLGCGRRGDLLTAGTLTWV